MEKSFADLEQQVQVVSKNRGQLIQHVCSIVRITTDAARLTRTLTLLADFARSLPNLKDFWVLFQTTPDVAASEGAGPVKVFALDAVNMGHLELALRDKASLRRLSLICESTAEDQPTVLLRLPSAMSIFESLRHLQTLALRGCIPVPAANEAKDLSLLSPTLSRLKIHNAGILRTHTSVLTDSWHFCITPRLPPQLTRLALVLVDTTLPNLLRLLASAANTLDRLSLMGVFLTDVHDDPQSTLDERGAVRCQELAKIIKPLHLGALSFGRVTCLTGNAGGQLPAAPGVFGFARHQTLISNCLLQPHLPSWLPCCSGSSMGHGRHSAICVCKQATVSGPQTWSLGSTAPSGLGHSRTCSGGTKTARTLWPTDLRKTRRPTPRTRPVEMPRATTNTLK